MADFFDAFPKALYFPSGIILSDEAPKKLQLKETDPRTGPRMTSVAAEAAKPEASVSSAPYTTVAMLDEIDKIVASNLEWTAGAGAEKFFKELPQLRKTSAAAAKYLAAIAQKGGVDKVNAFLKERGFSIELQPPANPDSISAASVFDLAVRWKIPGFELPIRISGKDAVVPGVWIKKPLRYLESTGHKHPIIELETESGERFFVTRYESALDAANPLAATDAAATLSANRKEISAPPYPDGVLFPMASYEKSGDMTWLAGSIARDKSGNSFPLGEAKYVHRFRLDEEGARAEAANSANLLSAAPSPLTIDGAYLAWFELKAADNTVVPFAILVVEENMKRPDSI